MEAGPSEDDRDRLPRPERRRFAAEAGEEDRWQLVNFADAVDAEVLVAAKVEEEDDDLSDIVSISGDSTGGEVKEVNVGGAKPKRTRRKKKTEINL